MTALLKMRDFFHISKSNLWYYKIFLMITTSKCKFLWKCQLSRFLYLRFCEGNKINIIPIWEELLILKEIYYLMAAYPFISQKTFRFRSTIAVYRGNFPGSLIKIFYQRVFIISNLHLTLIKCIFVSGRGAESSHTSHIFP